MIGRRRVLIGVGAGAFAAARSLGAGAQQPARLLTVGFLGADTAAGQRAWTNAFVQRLRELGWIEGRTLAIEYRWAEGRTERYAEIARELDILDTASL